MPRADIEPYRGKWVAFDYDDDSIVMVADTADALRAALDATCPDRRVLMRGIPEHGEPWFVGSLL